VGKLKKMGGYLSKGIPGSAGLRSGIHAASTCEEILALIREFFAGGGV